MGQRNACWYENRIQIYAANVEELLAFARTRVKRKFTLDECQRFFDAKEPTATLSTLFTLSIVGNALYRDYLASWVTMSEYES